MFLFEPLALGSLYRGLTYYDNLIVLYVTSYVSRCSVFAEVNEKLCGFTAIRSVRQINFIACSIAEILRTVKIDHR